MTRKDMIALAALVKARVTALEETEDNGMAPQCCLDTRRIGVETLANEVADMIAEHSPTFDRER